MFYRGLVALTSSLHASRHDARMTRRWLAIASAAAALATLVAVLALTTGTGTSVASVAGERAQDQQMRALLSDRHSDVLPTFCWF